MVKQLNKQISYEFSRSRKKLSPLTFRDFLIFYKKFCGTFIFRGRRSLSIKIFNYIMLNLKKKRKGDPMRLFYLIIKKITPFLTVGQKKFGFNVVGIPSLLYGNKKNVYVLNWLVRQLRNKSNVHGVKKEDVLKSLLDILSSRGNVLRAKAEHNRRVMLTRINLKNEKKDTEGKIETEWDRLNYDKSKVKYWKEEIIKLNEGIIDEAVEDEFELWKEVEHDYDFMKFLKSSMAGKKRKKNSKNLLNFYKKTLVN